MKIYREITLPAELSGRLTAVYDEIQQAYDGVARRMGLTCSGCPDNCCDSYFLHYTYTEWAYLWEGLRKMEEKKLAAVTERAAQYREHTRRSLAGGSRPGQMCPLEEGGRCTLYSHRMLICRLHGIPAVMTRPDGRKLRFPGCFRCQEIAGAAASPEDLPAMDRTAVLGKIAEIESELLRGRRHLFPRVKKTIADMIADGPPLVDKPFCER
jgi:hypothetical protein